MTTVVPNAALLALQARVAGLEQRPLRTRTPRLLGLGDSITVGALTAGGSVGGYRRNLSLQTVRAKPVYVGPVNDDPPPCAGYYGFRSDQTLNGGTDGAGHVAPPLNTLLAQNPANVIILLIGTNDAMQSVSQATYLANVRAILSAIAGLVPVPLVLVSDLPANQFAQSLVDGYNAALPGLVSGYTVMGQPIFFVQCGSLVPLGELQDGVHPNQVGYDAMGTRLAHRLDNLTA